MTIEPRSERLPDGPLGERPSEPEQRLLRMPHGQMDFVLVKRFALGEDALPPLEIEKHDKEVLESVMDVMQLNMQTEPSIPILEHQWMRTGVLNGRISTHIPKKQRPSVLASPEAIVQSLEEGETLTGVIAAAAWLEDKRRPHARGLMKSRHKGASEGELLLKPIVNKSIIRGFGFAERQEAGAQSAVYMWGRALQLLPHLRVEGASQLLVPIAQGLEQSLTLNADWFQRYLVGLKNMAAKATRARDMARTRLPERIKVDIMLSDLSAEDKVTELRREQLGLQRRLLMADLYPPEPSVSRRSIPHPRGPRD